MKLTRRQEKFIDKMVELKREFASPIHYSVLAERLGVSPFTAYDMLCLLEEKGYVISEYKLPVDKCGPGRAERLFYPSEMALAKHQQLVEQLDGEHLDTLALKTFALENFLKGEMPDSDLTKQMMARLLPNGHGEMRYCVEVMTVAAYRVKHSPGWNALLEHLLELLPGEGGSCKANLGLLAGFIYGLLVEHGMNTSEWQEMLREHLQSYLDLVMVMTVEDCTRLARQLRDLFTSLIEIQAQ